MSSPLQQHEPDLAGSSTHRTIANLIESAAASFEVDPDCSRDCLYRAAALLRSRGAIYQQSGDRSAESLPCAGLLGWQISRVVGHIDSSLAKPIKGKDLAELIGLSVGQLVRAFKVSVGITPFQYIAQRRIERACEMMRTTLLPLREVAVVCGFRHQAQFCRVFRRMVGQSPSHWRRANSTGPSPTPAHPTQAIEGTRLLLPNGRCGYRMP